MARGAGTPPPTPPCSLPPSPLHPFPLSHSPPAVVPLVVRRYLHGNSFSGTIPQELPAPDQCDIRTTSTYQCPLPNPSTSCTSGVSCNDGTSAYFTVDGPCTVIGACVRSPNHPFDYGDGQSCTITPERRCGCCTLRRLHDHSGAAVAATRLHIVRPFHLNHPGWHGRGGRRRWRRRRFWRRRGRRRRGERADAIPG